MKKIFLSSLVVLGISTLIIVSCKDKNNNSITPTYKSQSGGTGANPNINVVTITTTVEPVEHATQNSVISVGGSGWNYDACSINGNVLTGRTGNTQVQILFGGGPVTNSTYAFTSGIPTAGQARMIVNSAPNQPESIVWYSKSGSCSVVTSTAMTTATFSNIQCVQLNYLFPVVGVSGSLICQ